MTEEGAELVAALIRKKKLVELDLYNNDFGDEGMTKVMILGFLLLPGKSVGMCDNLFVFVVAYFLQLPCCSLMGSFMHLCCECVEFQRNFQC